MCQLSLYDLASYSEYLALQTVGERHIWYVLWSPVSGFGKLVHPLYHISGIQLCIEIFLCCILSYSNYVLLALFASLNLSLSSSLLVIWNCLNVALFEVTAFRVSSCHHQVSFSVYVPFPAISPNTSFVFPQWSGLCLANLDYLQHSGFSATLLVRMHHFLPVSSSSTI